MSECQEKAEEEFDIARIIEKQRDFRQEIEIIKHTLRMEEDPLFKEINPLGIINFEVEGKENFSSGTPIRLFLSRLGSRSKEKIYVKVQKEENKVYLLF